MTWELERHAWGSLASAGSAVGVPKAIRDLAEAKTEADARAAYWRIDNTVVVQGAVHEAALACVPCILSALLHCTLHARHRFLELLVQIGSGEVVEGARFSINDCLGEISRGFGIYLDVLERSSDPAEQSVCIDLIGLSCRDDPSLQVRAIWYLRKAQSLDLDAAVRRLLDDWLEELSP